MRSFPFPTRRTALTLMCCASGALLLTACATAGPPTPQQPRPSVPAELREPCSRPARPAAPDLGGLALFSVRQEAALNTCEGRKDAAVGLLDAAAAALDEAAGKKGRRR